MTFVAPGILFSRLEPQYGSHRRANEGLDRSPGDYLRDIFQIADVFVASEGTCELLKLVIQGQSRHPKLFGRVTGVCLVITSKQLLS
jgi:hypothetical protein